MRLCYVMLWLRYVLCFMVQTLLTDNNIADRQYYQHVKLMASTRINCICINCFRWLRQLHWPKCVIRLFQIQLMQLWRLSEVRFSRSGNERREKHFVSLIDSSGSRNVVCSFHGQPQSWSIQIQFEQTFNQLAYVYRRFGHIFSSEWIIYSCGINVPCLLNLAPFSKPFALPAAIW